ncbi:MAG: TIGR02186 family protein [Hyphomicrobiaceae bacterium]
MPIARHTTRGRQPIWWVIITAALLAAVTTCASAQRSGNGLPPEAVQADVSTRTVGITSNFTGTEIIVFGAISNAREPKTNEEQYDVVVVVEGVGSSLVARRKSNVGGIWVNTDARRFRHIPSYYAIASTRPLDEITEGIILDQHGIGFEHISMPLDASVDRAPDPSKVANYKAAVIRLKQKQRLYVQDEFGVVFVGKSLFRATIDLPANVPVGPLTTRVHLFREGILLDTFTSKVQLSREGIGRYLYTFAIGYPLLYGIAAVFVAAGAGWAASAFFSRSRS